MKAHWTLAVVGVAALVLASGCQAAQGPVEEVVIGADLELSGAGAPIGKVYAQALQLKIEQVNQEGLLGNRKLTLAMRDNRSEPATSVANIKALAADPSVAVIISGVCGDCLLEAAKPIAEAKIPTISLALHTAISTPIADRRYVFKVAPNLADDATVLTGEMDRAQTKKIALIASDDSLGKDAIEETTSKASRIGLTVVPPERVAPAADAEKIGVVTARVVRAKPEAVAVLAFSPLASQIGQSLRKAGFTGDLYFGSAAAESLFLTGANAPALDGAQMVFTPTLVSDDIIATSPAKATRIAWFRDFLSKYGTYAAYASFAADAVQIIDLAIRQVNGTDRDALRTAIETTRLDGLSGPIRFTPDNHSGLTPQAVTMLVAANGRWRLVS